MIRFEDVPDILRSLVREKVPEGWPSGPVSQVEQDSRRLGGDGLFVAVSGLSQDGRSFLSDAAERGARAAVGSAPATGPLPYLCVRDPRKAIALLSARFQGDPSHEVEVVGVTGTNGKSTTTWLLQAIWEGCGVPAAVAGTLGVGRPGSLADATHTTADAPRFQESLRRLADGGIRAVAAEISSHALDQDRAYGTRFRCAVFTNLTRDHLDYHGTFETYRRAKGKLFRPEGRGDSSPCVAVVNVDDPAAADLVAGSSDPVLGYGTSAAAAIRLGRLDVDARGSRMHLTTPRGPRTVASPLLGAFNGWNVLAAYAAASALDLPAAAVEEALARGVRVPGRMERVDRGQPFLVVVDYAHTPDALARALGALRPLTRGRLLVLFGCGGDRDQGKRGEMGEVAAAAADRILLTSDNPRSEDPLAILAAIVEGVRARGRAPDLVTPDREEAIRAALEMAEAPDTLLIAGKGHETYQESGGVRRPFDDREVARRNLAALGWNG